jgi:hypothetical protein
MRTTGRRLSREEADARMARIVERRAAGDTWRVIGAEFSVDEHTISAWFLRRKNGPLVPVKGKPPTTPRLCLRCRDEFPSVGPGNRLCDPCRDYAHHQSSPYDADPGGDTGKRVQARR